MMFLYLILGVVGGVLQSMGLGGGSIIIPLLSFIGIVQKSAQLVNVFAFIVMVAFLLIVGSQRGLVSRSLAILIGSVGAVTSLVFSLLVQGIDNSSLKVYFGVFLLIIVFFETVSFFKKYIKN